MDPEDEWFESLKDEQDLYIKVTKRKGLAFVSVQFQWILSPKRVFSMMKNVEKSGTTTAFKELHCAMYKRTELYAFGRIDWWIEFSVVDTPSEILVVEHRSL